MEAAKSAARYILDDPLGNRPELKGACMSESAACASSEEAEDAKELSRRTSAPPAVGATVHQTAFLWWHLLLQMLQRQEEQVGDPPVRPDAGRAGVVASFW